ncbi:MAG: DUF2798 domain-containing protein [Pseudolabrys sp.]
MAPSIALAAELNAAAAARQRDQRRGADQIKRESPPHPAKMRDFYLMRLQCRSLRNSLRIRKRFKDLTCGLPLDRARRFRSHSHGRLRENSMEGKARFIFPVLITAVIVFIVSGVVTFTNIRLRADFVPRWLKAFFTGWQSRSWWLISPFRLFGAPPPLSCGGSMGHHRHRRPHANLRGRTISRPGSAAEPANSPRISAGSPYLKFIHCRKFRQRLILPRPISRLVLACLRRMEILRFISPVHRTQALDTSRVC